MSTETPLSVRVGLSICGVKRKQLFVMDFFYSILAIFMQFYAYMMINVIKTRLIQL